MTLILKTGQRLKIINSMLFEYSEHGMMALPLKTLDLEEIERIE